MNMDTIVLLIISLLAALGGNIVKKLYTNREEGLFGTFLYTAVGSLVSALLLLLPNGFGEASVFTLLLGALFGLVVTLQLVTNLVALHLGPMAYTTVIISFSTLITALSGILFFDEQLTLLKGIGIFLMLASFVFAANEKAEKKRANFRWILFCAISFFMSGAIGIMQKVHQTSPHREELNAFLVIAFVVSTILSAGVALFFWKRGKQTKGNAPKSGSLQFFLFSLMVINGICTGLNHRLNLYLSGVMESAIFFPIVNGGGLILATIAALLLFREKLSSRQWVGIGLGIASVVALCVG